MNKDIRVIVSAAVVMLLIGCATTQVPSGVFNAKNISTTSYGKKVDTFVIIQDASSSMDDKYMERSKIDIARETLTNMNQTIPQLDFNVGLTAFGTGGCINNTEVLHGPEKYSNTGLAEGIRKINCAAGTTPMESGINYANSKILTGSGPGKIALFIVSDGITDESHHSDTTRRKNAIDAARKVKNQLGDRACIYPILIGDETDSIKFMNELAAIGGCGFAINHMDINSPNHMASYVTKTLLEPIVAAAPKIDTSPEKITFSADALFDFDKAVLKIKGKQSLDNLIVKLGKVKYDVIVAVGYTDRIGSEDYNKKLSLKRAEAVKSYLVATHSVDPRIVFVDGKGEANPIIGTTCRGKGKKLIDCLQPDRRVEIEIAGIRQ